MQMTETPEYISVMQQFAGTHVSLDDIDVCGSQKCQTCLGIDSDDRRHSVSSRHGHSCEDSTVACAVFIGIDCRSSHYKALG